MTDYPTPESLDALYARWLAANEAGEDATEAAMNLLDAAYPDDERLALHLTDAMTPKQVRAEYRRVERAVDQEYFDRCMARDD